VLNQSRSNVEVIVVDDGSTDDTKAVLMPYIASKKIKYFYQKNKGASSARNFGIEKACGQYIGFLDADDIFLPGMIECCLKEIEEKNMDLVSVDNYMVYLDGDREIKREKCSYDWIEKEPEELFCTFLRVGGIGGIYKAFFHRSVFNRVGNLDISLPVYEDLDLWIRIAGYGLKWGHIRKPLVQYNCRGAGTSLFTHSKQRNQDCRLLILRRYKHEAIRRCSHFRTEAGKQLWNMGRSYILENKSYIKGIGCLFESFCVDPDLKRPLNSLIGFLGNSGCVYF